MVEKNDPDEVENPADRSAESNPKNAKDKVKDIAVFEDALYAANTAKQADFYTVAVRDDSNQPHWETLTALTDEAILDWPTAAQTL